MRLDLDAYIPRRSPIHAWETRCKFIGCMALIFAFAFVQQLWLLPLMLIVTIGLYGLSRLPLAYLRQRLRYPSLFLLGLVVFIPFIAGETVFWQWQGVRIYQEGVGAVVLIATRFFSILTIALVLIGTTPFLTLLTALRSLGLSPILADITMLTYRYLYDVMDNFATMQTAMRLRGAQQSTAQSRRNPLWHRLTQVASLMGTLLIRSYEQSERVYKAMRLRGYGTATSGTISDRPEGSIAPSSLAALGFAIAIAVGFVVAEVWITPKIT